VANNSNNKNKSVNRGGGSLTAKHYSSNNNNNEPVSKFRNFRDANSYLAYYKAEKFATILSAMKLEQTPQSAVAAVTTNSVPTQLFNTYAAPVQQQQQPNTVFTNTSTSIVNLNPSNIYTVMSHNHARAYTPDPPPGPSRAVTNIGFRMDSQNGSGKQRGNGSDAFMHPAHQKFIPYTSQGTRGAGGGTIRLHPKAYKSKYQYQFARNLIGKIISSNQQHTRSLLKKNEKFLNSAMAVNSLGGGHGQGGFNSASSGNNTGFGGTLVSASGLNREGNKENVLPHQQQQQQQQHQLTRQSDVTPPFTDDHEEYSYYDIANLNQSKICFYFITNF
jgi:hypothetical protein